MEVIEQTAIILAILFSAVLCITLATFARLSDLSVKVQDLTYKLDQLRQHIFRKDSKKDLEEWRWQDGEPPPWESGTENDLPEV